ncbi:ABC-F family ATP-binding cassette domain-containing protein [Eubacterium oxidoreducens]|uniref:ATP-binding cassette, subfamily F, uup n=1 Tax=Eubacterium oxidoreducens TaxID=1732 RepID=A0A1G6C738_EUBOX|nr:ABC-F family ATP-binding cassette domain-containing protein [Eubacterium oxidoreducens]SDB28664.1 ATP-binding cassette, subfamily F, uup [Eubacterium oxidoreducens]
MNIFSLQNITKSYGAGKLFEDTSFFLQQGEKVGIIGINGTGKSTLLKMIAGEEEPDAGSRTVANHVVIRYLPQNPRFEASMQVLEQVLQILKEEHLEDMEGAAKNMLTTLGLNHYEQPIKELSGGQRKRLALAIVLLVPCDLLILDEPTNHLDHFMADWLEEYLRNRQGALVMVTHDRYFLDAVSNRIVEIDHGKIYNYNANYSGYLERKAQREEMQEASERKRQAILRNELKWVMRGALARSTKQKARLERYENLKNQPGISEDDKLKMSSVSTRMGKTTIEIEHLCKAYGNRVLISDFTYYFLKHDRIGFVGTNGCGKTTLMRMLIGEEPYDSGTIKIGQTIKIGYYSQEIVTDPKGGIAYMDPKIRVIDYIKNTAEFVRTSDGLISASKMAERFLFSGEEQYSLIEKLSGGERRRLNLLRVLMEAPNVLILDEPTNDLDIATLTVLEDYLDHFEGIVITVSHDRYFLDRTVRRIFAFEEGGVLRQYEGGYTDYLNRLKAEGRQPEQLQNIKQPSGKKTTTVVDEDGHVLTGKAAYKASKVKVLKFTYQEQKDYDMIESEIEKLEDELEVLEKEMLAAGSDYGKLRELSEKKDECEKQLELKMERWEYLEEKAQKIQDRS